MSAKFIVYLSNYCWNHVEYLLLYLDWLYTNFLITTGQSARWANKSMVLCISKTYSHYSMKGMHSCQSWQRLGKHIQPSAVKAVQYLPPGFKVANAWPSVYQCVLLQEHLLNQKTIRICSIMASQMLYFVRHGLWQCTQKNQKTCTRVKTTNLKISVYPYNYDIITILATIASTHFLTGDGDFSIIYSPTPLAPSNE